MATFEEQRLFEECSELRARLTTANKENEKLTRERDEAVAAFHDATRLRSHVQNMRLAAEAQVHALRVLVSRLMVVVDGKETGGAREVAKVYNDAHAALALPPGDALRALAVRLCEAQREADRSAFLSLLKQARSEVSGLKEYRPSLGVDVCENMTLRREHQAPLVVDDVLGKAGE